MTFCNQTDAVVLKILIFAHNASAGGAENALRHLVDRLRIRHEVHVVLPMVDSHEGRHYKDLGLRCFELKVPMVLPSVAQGALGLLAVNWQHVAKVLQEEQYELLISNTLTILHGQLLAQFLGRPHLTYVHEFLADAELMPTGLDRTAYLQLILDGSAGVLGCSSMVLAQFEGLQDAEPALRAVLPPFDFKAPTVPRPTTASPPFQSSAPERVLQVIGTVSHRKNVVFATTVAKALKVLGVPARVDFTGTRNNASAKLEQMLRKRGIEARVLPHRPDPYAENLGSSVITLACAHSEPYGLTLTESLRLGIPAVASRSGGPQEVLPADALFDVDDVDGCVRILQAIWADYGAACTRAHETYVNLQSRVLAAEDSGELDAFLGAVSRKPIRDQAALIGLLQMLKRLVEIPIGVEQLQQSLMNVAAEEGLALSQEDLRLLIERERQEPGHAVTADIKRFGAVPFGMSPAMDRLYARGLGLAIELAATFNGPERVQMAAFIACSLWQAERRASQPLTILALGDGAGIDSIRLAKAGFTVHYMDYEQSNMAKVAARNFKACDSAVASGEMHQAPRTVRQVEQPYDAIVCLEVIEHVPDPMAFIKFMAQSLKPQGWLFISDCFNGVEDRWPTHLASNEGFAGQLPFLMQPWFRLVDVNRRPYAKPYVFRKREVDDAVSPLELMKHREVMADLVRHQVNLGGV